MSYRRSRYSSRSSGSSAVSWTIMTIILLTLSLCIVGAFAYGSSEDKAQITPDKLERVAGDGDSRYMVWSEEGEVFEITDTFTFGRFDSADLYGDLEIGQTYCARVAGWRVHFLSWNRNILSVDEGECPEGLVDGR